MFIHTQFENTIKDHLHIKTKGASEHSSCTSKTKKDKLRRKSRNLFFPCYHRDTVSWAFQNCTHFNSCLRKREYNIDRVNVSFVSHVDVNSPFEVMDQGGEKIQPGYILILPSFALYRIIYLNLNHLIICFSGNLVVEHFSEICSVYEYINCKCFHIIDVHD